MPDLIDLARFRGEFRAGKRPESPVWRLQQADPFVVDAAARKVRFVFSDGSVDRMGDTIDPKGWVVDSYLKNPVVLWAHDSLSPPIGRASNLLIEDMRLCGDVEFAAAEVYGFADLIFRLLQAKFLNAGSVGFLPLDYSWSSDKEREFGIDFKAQELLEYSIVPVPANANALAEARKSGIDTRPLVDWAEKMLDGGQKVLVPIAELEKLRKMAAPPRSLARKSAAEWHVGAARDLPLDDSDDWDGPAAAKRMLDACGFGGDAPDTEKARRGFLIYDGSAPALRGSYKEPFADLVVGALKAVKGGVRAAASRLPQTEAPADVLEAARGVIDHYEERFGMGKSARRRRRDGMSETDPGTGGFLTACKFGPGEECGLADPMQCEVHGPLLQGGGKAILAAVRAMIAAGLKALPDGEDDAKGLHQKALEHGQAIADCMKDLAAIDPEGKAFGGDAHCKALADMHAHVKAADDYLEKCRAALNDDDADDASGGGGEAEARAARLESLRR
jgi:HK97 family phage prohead protease